MDSDLKTLDDFLFGEDVPFADLLSNEDANSRSSDSDVDVGSPESDFSSQYCDIDSPEVLVNAQSNPEVDDELVSYLTKRARASDESRVLKMDSRGKLRMGKTIRVLNQAPELFASSRGVDYNRNYRTCQSKSAIAARENREKKKRYVAGLEASVNRLKYENKKLTDDRCSLTKEADSLREEVRYLRNVLANQSTLSSLLKNIPNVSGLSFVGGKLTSDITAPKRKPSVDDETIRTKQRRVATDPEESSTSGICLHVSQSRVSMELCASCSNVHASASQV